MGFMDGMKKKVQNIDTKQIRDKMGETVNKVKKTAQEQLNKVPLDDVQKKIQNIDTGKIREKIGHTADKASQAVRENLQNGNVGEKLEKMSGSIASSSKKTKIIIGAVAAVIIAGSVMIFTGGKDGQIASKEKPGSTVSSDANHAQKSTGSAGNNALTGEIADSPEILGLKLGMNINKANKILSKEGYSLYGARSHTLYKADEDISNNRNVVDHDDHSGNKIPERGFYIYKNAGTPPKDWNDNIMAIGAGDNWNIEDMDIPAKFFHESDANNKQFVLKFSNQYKIKAPSREVLDGNGPIIAFNGDSEYYVRFSRQSVNIHADPDKVLTATAMEEPAKTEVNRVYNEKIINSPKILGIQLGMNINNVNKILDKEGYVLYGFDPRFGQGHVLFKTTDDITRNMDSHDHFNKAQPEKLFIVYKKGDIDPTKIRQFDTILLNVNDDWNVDDMSISSRFLNSAIRNEQFIKSFCDHYKVPMPQGNIKSDLIFDKDITSYDAKNGYKVNYLEGGVKITPYDEESTKPTFR